MSTLPPAVSPELFKELAILATAVALEATDPLRAGMAYVPARTVAEIRRTLELAGVDWRQHRRGMLEERRARRTR